MRIGAFGTQIYNSPLKGGGSNRQQQGMQSQFHRCSTRSLRNLRIKVFANRLPSCDQLADDFAMHVGQAHVAPPETECQLPVIDSELVEDRCVDVVDRRGVLDY